MTPFSILRFVSMGAMAAFGVACVVDTTDRDPPPRYESGGSATPDPSASSLPTTAPILVVVDTGKTMTAMPGQGVGIFTEYTHGGHWHVWWTCDTSAPTGPHQACAFDVTATLASGSFTNVMAESLGDTDRLTEAPQRLHATSTTTNGIQGAYFDAPLGASIVLQGSVGGISDSSFFFFVQNGKVNGGFEGKLSNPLEFQASVP